MQTLFQFLRYAIVGLGANLVLFVLYLVITELGIGHKTAMTFLYAAGVLSTFVFNRNWSFKHDGTIPASLLKYLLTYLSGYLINLGALYYLVDVRGLPHQWVQGAMIFLLAAYLFLVQKLWVFPRRAKK